MATKKGGQRCCCIAVSILVILVIVELLLIIVFATKSRECTPEQPTAMPITREAYGTTKDGKQVYRYTLKNKAMEVKILNYGGIITNIMAPDKHGQLGDIALGFDNIEGYETNDPYFGALIGRYANRIAKGHFILDRVLYNLTINNGPNALHGGPTGFHKRIWDSKVEDDLLVLTYVSKDGEEHYPGEVKVTVTYKLSDENALVINYNATTNKATVINLTSHGYYNLAGQSAGTLNNHNITLDATHYTPVDNTSIPTGVIAPVSGTKFDLTFDTNLGARIPEVPGGIGFDHNFVFGKNGQDKHMARVTESTTGRTIDVYSTQPGVQFYTSYYLEGTKGKGGFDYPKFGGFCLETQHYPDSPNEPSFPTTVLRPGEVFRQTTRYVFGVVDS